jgi:glycerol-3-phosphate acyltransferase PlsY
MSSSITGFCFPSTLTFKDGNSVRLTFGMINSELNAIVTLPSAVMLVMLAVFSLGFISTLAAGGGGGESSHLKVRTIL